MRCARFSEGSAKKRDELFPSVALRGGDRVVMTVGEVGDDQGVMRKALRAHLQRHAAEQEAHNQDGIQAILEAARRGP